MSWARAELSIYVCVLLWAGGVGNGVDGFFSVWFPFAIARNGNPRATSNDSITTDKKKLFSDANNTQDLLTNTNTLH